MSTIVTRASKGQALTWQEGDDNIINLNTDKLESVSEDTAPSLGGDLDVAAFSIVSTNNNNIQITPDGSGKISLDGVRWPKISTGGGGEVQGTVTAIDDQRTPNTITLSNFGGITVGNAIIFTGTQVSSAGLVENQQYEIASDLGAGEFEIADPIDSNPALIQLTDVAPYTDFNYTVTTSGGSGLAGGEVLTYNTDGDLTWTAPSGGGGSLNDLSDVNAPSPGNSDVLAFNTGTSQWEAQSLPASGIASISEDSAPSLGGNLDVAGNSIVSANDGNIVLAPNGTGKTVVGRLNYSEAVFNISAGSGTIAPNAADGNVQSILLNGNITLNAFTSPVAGQSITLIVNTNGTGRTLTSSMKFAGGEKTLSTTNTTDIISIFYDGTDYYASLSKDFK
jgi:hypothetical protein